MSDSALRDTLLQLLISSLQLNKRQSAEIRTALLTGSAFIEAGLDSLEVMEFFLHVEDAFHIEIPNERYGELNSLPSIAAYLQSTLSTIR